MILSPCVQAPDPSLCAQVSVTSSHSCCSTGGSLLICFVTAKQFDFLFLASICEGGSPSKSIVSKRTGGQCVPKPHFLSCESSHCPSGSFSSTHGHSRMLKNARARSEPSARAALAMLSLPAVLCKLRKSQGPSRTSRALTVELSGPRLPKPTKAPVASYKGPTFV